MELPDLRVLWARWCAAAVITDALAAGGAALPTGFTVDGAVARYRSSAAAGAMLARFGADRAVLSCGDVSWRVAAAPSAAELVAGLPDWVDHVCMVDHRVRAGHFGWASTCAGGRWSDPSPPDGAALPPLLRTVDLAGILGAALGAGQGRRDVMFHLIRMAEYQYLDADAWRAGLGGAVPADALDRGWERLREHDLVRTADRGPVTVGVPGRDGAEAETMALAHLRRLGRTVPEDVRVVAGFRRERGWDVRISDYRDAERGTAVTVAVDDDGTVHLS